MPIFRIVYIDDDTFAPRTLNAAFPDRAAAEIAMAKHGHRVAHIAEMGPGENERDPVKVPMASGCDKRTVNEPTRAQPQIVGVPAHEAAGVIVLAAGIAMACAAFLLF